MLTNSVLTDYAYSSILELILSLEIKPGERIREDLLAKKFGISRTPVREAVNQLTQNGFVVNIKRKGLYCVDITKKDLLNLLDLRIALESLSFIKCIELATEADIENFRGIINGFYQKYNQILRNLDQSSAKEIAVLHNEYDIKFHVGIAEVSQSNRLIKYINEVENTLLIARQRIFRNVDRTWIVLLSWKQHELMLESIEARDRAGALNMLDQHLKLMKDTQVEIEETGNASKAPDEAV